MAQPEMDQVEELEARELIVPEVFLKAEMEELKDIMLPEMVAVEEAVVMGKVFLMLLLELLLV